MEFILHRDPFLFLKHKGGTEESMQDIWPQLALYSSKKVYTSFRELGEAHNFAVI